MKKNSGSAIAAAACVSAFDDALVVGLTSVENALIARVEAAELGGHFPGVGPARARPMQNPPIAFCADGFCRLGRGPALAVRQYPMRSVVLPIRLTLRYESLTLRGSACVRPEG